MKTLSKRVFAFFVAVCMIAPMLALPASATDNVSSCGIPDGCVAVSENETAALTIDSLKITSSDFESDDEIDPHLTPDDRDMGVGVRRIIVYPMGINTETNELFIHPQIFKSATYINWNQSQSIRLTKNETMLLMNQLWNVMSSAGENYYLIGWYLESTVEFDYKNPEYLLARRCGTNITTDPNEPEERRELYASDPPQLFKALFSYPEGYDALNDYYYVGVSGGVYYIGSTGKHASALFSATVTFNN